VRKTVNVPISTDKGMCGGINSNVAKLANACTEIDAQGVLYSSIVGSGLTFFACAPCISLTTLPWYNLGSVALALRCSAIINASISYSSVDR
jgi:hypothetical protein